MCILLVLLHRYIKMHGSKNVKYSFLLSYTRLCFQQDHSYSKHGVSKPRISAPPKTGDTCTWRCLETSFFTILRLTFSYFTCILTWNTSSNTVCQMTVARCWCTRICLPLTAIGCAACVLIIQLADDGYNRWPKHILAQKLSFIQ